MKMYGIGTCGSVKKAKKFFNDKDIAYEFIDFKKDPVGCEKIDEWLAHVPMKTLFNARGTKYRTLGLKDLALMSRASVNGCAKKTCLLNAPLSNMAAKSL